MRQLADLAILQGSHNDAISVLSEAVSGLSAVGAAAITSMLTARIGYLCAVQGRYEEADRWHDHALAAAEKQQHLPMLAFACNSKGVTLRSRGRLDEASQCHQLALDLCHQRGIPAGQAAAHASLGYIAELRHDAAAAALREITAGRLTAAERTDIDRAIARLHDHATLDAAFAEGHRDPRTILNLAAGRDARSTAAG